MLTLITGGLGYIGSHIANLLSKDCIVIDNQSNSKLNFKKFLPGVKVYIADVNYQNLCKIFNKHKIKCVIHMAGLKSVNDSVKLPLSYYENNVISTINLLKAMDKFNIHKLIFSSSATVYGDIHKSPISEDKSLKSLSPYGRTKIINENLISDYSLSQKKFKCISLRYFNPIGAKLNSGLSERPLGVPLNLMPVLINSVNNNKKISIFGDDYPTKDGTCIRDYIHVEDLADAHIRSLKSLHKIRGCMPINIGLGRGISVKELIETFQKVNKIKVDFKISKRRLGDAAIIFADNSRAKSILNWKPKKSYEDMCYDSWQCNIRE